MVELLIGLVFLLLIAAGVKAVSNRSPIPFSVMLVFSGILLSLLSRQFSEALPSLHEFELSSEVILFLFLPTLIYESSQGMDVRALRKSIVPVLTLAVPGLLLSTFLIGGFVAFLTPLSFRIALLLGAILSATDPVAVISIFKRLGAPKQLFVLVEGESLFNDATSIVLSRILVGLILGGGMGLASVGEGLVDFLIVFLGGLATGGLLGFLAGLLLERVRSESSVVISITTVLAYLSFILAEEFFHVSGVMAVVAAGLTFSGWGWMKVTPPVRTYLEHFWEYAAFLANALIFLFVGLNVEPGKLFEVWHILAWVIPAMLLSRAAVVYGISPLVEMRATERYFQPGYKPVLVWGGLRGAVALAIVLSMPSFGENELLESLVIGAVLFTIFIEGLSIEPLVKLLGLDRPTRTNRFIIAHHRLEAKRRALEKVKEFGTVDVFSRHVLEELTQRYTEAIEKAEEELTEFHVGEKDAGGEGKNREDEETQIIYSLTLSHELSVYMDLFNQGHLGEKAFRELQHDLADQFDTVRCMEDIRHTSHGRFHRRKVEHFLLSTLEQIPPLSPFAERRRRVRLAVNYEISWGHKEGSRRVLQVLDSLKEKKTFAPMLIESISTQYQHWNKTACRSMDQTAEQFPDFVQSVQQRLGSRLALIAEDEYIEEQTEHGSLPASFGEGIKEEIEERIEANRRQEIAKFHVDPAELLRKVSFLQDAGDDEFAFIVRSLIPKTYNEKETIIREGERGKSLFLITRGVVRISREEDGERKELGSLFAGDLFGEMALLRGERRNATARAITPSYLYELRRESLEKAMEVFPHIRRALEEVERGHSSHSSSEV